MKDAPWCVQFPRTVTRQQGIWCGLEGKGKEGRRQDQKGQEGLSGWLRGQFLWVSVQCLSKAPVCSPTAPSTAQGSH